MSSISDSWPAHELDAEMDALFGLTHAYYGTRFLDMWAGTALDDVKRIWAASISKLEPLDFKRGIDALANLEWPPTLPQFINLCRPPVDPTTAYYEALASLRARDMGEMGTWSHPAIFWTAARMAYELRSQSYSQIKQRWEKELAAELAKGQWDDIEKPALALPPPITGKHVPSEKYRRAISHINKFLSERSADPGFDHKRWARRILEQAQQPNHRMTSYQIQMAEEALKDP